MASYQERLGSFNQALSSTNEHIDRLKNTLQNPEVRENPVKLGLEVAGQVSGTVGGLTGVISRVRDGNVVRNVQKAFYDRIGQATNQIKNTTQGAGDALNKGVGSLKDIQTNAGNSLQSQTSQVAQNFKDAQQSAGSAVADAGKTATNSVQNVQTTASNTVSQSVDDAARSAVDGGLNARISNIPNAANPADEVSSIDRAINAKVNSTIGDSGRSALNNATPDLFKQRVAQVNDFDESNPLKLVGQQRLLQAKNNMANDAIARSKANIPAADGYDVSGAAVVKGAPATSAAPSAPNAVASTDASSGAASAGANQSSTVARSAAPTADASLPHGGNASVGTVADASKVTNAVGDTQAAGNAAQGAVADLGNSIAQKANALQLNLGQVPTQSGQGTVQGLTSSATASNPSGAAHTVAQAQQADAGQHANAQAPGSQTNNNTLPDNAATNADNAAKGAGTDASNLSGNASASAGANSAEDVGSGIKSALGVESTLDELAPDSGPLAPILEAGSLLATIGTGIASLFEPSEKKSTPAPAPTPIGLSVGANLKSNASQSVGAF